MARKRTQVYAGGPGGLRRLPANPFDPPAWKRYLRRSLNAEQRRILAAEYRTSQTHREARRLEKLAQEQRQAQWDAAILEIEVDLHPGGRAVLRNPGYGYRVELQWEWDQVAGRHSLRSWAAIAEDEPPPIDDDRHSFYVAFLLALTRGEQEAFGRAPRRRPAPGRPLDVPFYRRVLAMHDDLLKQGHRAPAAEIARRMGEKPATVRSWIFRAKRLEGGRGKG